MKSIEELSALKNEVESMNKKLAELSEEELEQVSGGVAPPVPRVPIILDTLETSIVVE